MRFRPQAAVVFAIAALGATAAGASGDGGGPAPDTRADFSPFARFSPVASSSPCVGDPGGPAGKPFVVPADYDQQLITEEPDPVVDQWDMNTQNESGTDAGRYVYQTHELFSGNSALSVVDLKTRTSQVLAQRTDWEGFDGIVWTPQGTVLAAEETRAATLIDPQFPDSTAGFVYEFFIDPKNPFELRKNDPRDDVAPFDDGLAARPALGSKSHEGMRYDKQGNLYGISESTPGGIFRFIPARKGDLTKGRLQALKTANGHDGRGTWIDIPSAAARTNAQAAAQAAGANGYTRPEDVETGESTGKDRNNGGNTLYVAITGSNAGPNNTPPASADGDEVLAIDLSRKDAPFAYDYVYNKPHSETSSRQAPNATQEFDFPDNLALDGKGNLAILEDPSTNTVGADVWIAAPPRGDDDDDDRGGKRHEPASTVQRFASLKDCAAEPSGGYFAMKGTEKHVEGTTLEGLVTDESLLIHRMHAGQGAPKDALVAIRPFDDDDDGGD